MELTKILSSGIDANSVTPAILTKIQSSFDANSSTLTVPNFSVTTVTAGNVKTNNLLYANGSAYVFSGSNAAGSNTQIQFNNANSFAASGNLTFDTTTNTLAATNFAGNGSGLSAITGANVSGQVSNALISGTVYTADQPNITSVGTLSSLSVTGNIASGNANLGNAVSANYFIGNGSQLTGITGSSITNGNSNVNIPSANGNVNISAVGNANVVIITGTGANINGYATISGNVTAGNISTSGSGGNITGANVISANTFTASGTVNFTSASNVTLGAVGNVRITGGTIGQYLQTDGSGTLTWSTVSSGAASNITNGNSNVNIPSANGNVNISAVGNANVLVVTGTGANINGYANITGNVIAGNILTSGSGGNITGANVISANTFTASGNITATNANLGNATTANYFIGNLYGTANIATYATTANSVAGVNVSGQVSNALIAGTVYTNAQPNITSVGTLSSLSVTGDISGANLVLSGNLTVSGTTTTVNSTVTRVVDPIFELGGGANGASLGSNDNKDRGTLLHYYTGSTATDAFMGWDNSNAEFAFGSNVSVTSEVVTFNSLGNVRASYFIGDGSQLTGITSPYGNSNVANYLPTFTGNLTAGNANLGNAVSANFFIGSGAFLTSVTAVTAATVTTNTQPNITSVGTLIDLTIGNATANSTFGNGTITATGNISFTGANVSLGSVGNLKIDGGTSGYFLTTDGSGNLSWGAASGGGGVSATGSNTQLQFNDGGALGASANLTFDKATNTFATARITASNGANLGSNVANVYIGGGSNNQILKTDGSGNLSWIAQPATTIIVDNFTGDGSTVVFTLSVSPTSINQTAVNYNGTLQLRTAYTVSGSTLTFSEAPVNGSLIEVTTTLGVMSGAGAFVTRSYTGNGVQSTFAVTSGCTVSSVIVTENGLVQVPTVDYTISGSTLTFNGAPASGIIINIRELAIAVATPSGITWNIASSNITMSANNGYFVDTSGGAKTMTLPSSAILGDTIRINDLAGTFGTNNLTVARNGHKIQGDTNDLLVDTDQTSFGLVYSNSTYGWKVLEL